MHATSEHLVARGHSVDFLFREQLQLQSPARFRRFSAPVRIIQLVRRAAREGRCYDAVEIHEPLAAAYAAVRRFDSTLPPLVVISHGVESRAHSEMIRYAAAKRIPMTLKQKYGYRLTTLWQSDFALRHADHVIVLNDEDREHLISNRRFKADRITVIHSAAGGPFLQCPPGASPGAGVIFMASWLDRKGVPDAIPVLTRVIREFPGLPVTIAGCGASEEVVLAGFPLDCRASIRVVPRILTDDDLLHEYRRHAIYLLPSVFEGQPLTMLEAAASGLALVCTDTCGMKDFIRHGENGLLAAVGDQVGLGDAVTRLLRDPSLTARLGREAQFDAGEFTWERSADRYLAGVTSAIQSPANRENL